MYKGSPPNRRPPSPLALPSAPEVGGERQEGGGEGEEKRTRAFYMGLCFSLLLMALALGLGLGLGLKRAATPSAPPAAPANIPTYSSLAKLGLPLTALPWL